MSDYISVAIDGPSGAGKSTISKALAKELNFIYVDTGAMYRCIGLAVKRAGINPKNPDEIAKILPDIDIKIEYDDNGTQQMILNGENVSAEIRTPEASIYASDVSAHPVVRSFLLDTQRNLAATNNVIMDGRDIGTVVLPNAKVKIFLTASPEQRARRRFNELCEKGIATTFDDVLKDINYRDKQDSQRAAAPLKPADDSVLLDTSEMNFAQSVDAMKKIIEDKTK